MNTQTDQQLLRDYAGHRSESAFAELVRRHLDLVYSAALRMVCDSHLAQDVTQSVFIALANNAGQLTRHPVLSGWLHRTTQNLAANAVRTNVRRQTREQEAVAMNQLLAHETDAAWENIAPHLDAALGDLSEPDRDALLLRYFERKSAREMAEVLNVSEEAAQKRVNRAVEHLRELFSKRNVTVGASGLAVLISTNAVQGAPIGLIASISSIATSATITIATHTTMHWINVKSITAIFAAALAAGTVTHLVKERRINDLEREFQNLRAQHEQLVTEHDAAGKAAAANKDEVQRLQKNQFELLKLRNEIGRLRPLEAELAKLREELARKQMQNAANLQAQTSNQEVIQKFEAERAVTINAMKQLGLELRILMGEKKLEAGFTSDGNLNPDLLAKSLPHFDLKKVETLVNEPAQVEKLIDEAPGMIVARTVEPIPTPDGRWLRLYLLADGSVQSSSTQTPDQAFSGEWQNWYVKPQR